MGTSAMLTYSVNGINYTLDDACTAKPGGLGNRLVHTVPRDPADW